MYSIEKGLVVSCQALANEPLHSSFIMSRMARAAEEAGAIGIRANSVVDIQAIQDTVDLPIIGLIKKNYGDCSVFITPTLKEVRAVASTGCEIVAMDGTQRERPLGENLPDILAIARQEYPHTCFMADCSTLADAQFAEEIGFDFIGTTLHGYTEETTDKNIADHDFQFLKDLLAQTNLPVIAEGKIDSPEKARRVLDLGAYSVVVGSSITRPQMIAQKYVEAIEK